MASIVTTASPPQAADIAEAATAPLHQIIVPDRGCKPSPCPALRETLLLLAPMAKSMKPTSILSPFHCVLRCSLRFRLMAVSSGRLTTIGWWVHDNPSKRLQPKIDFHVQKEGGDMNEITGLCARRKLSRRAPAYFANAGQHVGNGLLLPMMMNACSRSRRHFEQAAPDRGIYAQGRCDCGAAFRAGRLCRSAVEFSRAHDVDSSSCTHCVANRFESRRRDVTWGRRTEAIKLRFRKFTWN